MNRIIFEVALKPGAAEGNGRVWSTVRGKNVFCIYTRVIHCQILPTQKGIVRRVYVEVTSSLSHYEIYIHRTLDIYIM